MLRPRLQETLKEAMRAKDEPAVGTLRLILAALKDRDIASRGKTPDGLIPDEEILSLLQSMIKQRRESIDMYQKGGRPELAAKEQAEIAVIERFLPKQLSEEEAGKVIAAVIAETGAAGVRDMGKVMAELKKRYAGQMDFTRASGAVKEKLAG